MNGYCNPVYHMQIGFISDLKQIRHTVSSLRISLLKKPIQFFLSTEDVRLNFERLQLKS